MGGSNIELVSGFEDARSLSFEFADVLEDSIDVAELDRYLAAGDVNPLSRHVGSLLDEDAICVIAAVIKSSRLLVKADRKTGLNDALSQLPLVKGTLKMSLASADVIAFEGPQPLAFGCKAIRLSFDNGRYRAFQPVTPGKQAFAVDHAAVPSFEILDSTFARFV
jgi:hypothetical protein